MMYNEFVEGTKCKDNEFNYKLFQKFEEIYMMNDSFTKEQIYEAAKPFCDNSKSEAEIEAEEKIEAEKAEIRKTIEIAEADLERIKIYVEIETTKEGLKIWRERAKDIKNRIKEEKARLKELERWF